MTFTIFYVVGGKDDYYNQLNRSIRSLKKLTCNYKIKILDLNNKLKSYDNIEIINIDDNITRKEIIWQYKYHACKRIDTDYGLYMDCDTVMCSDRLEEFSIKIKESFGVIQHFHIKTYKNFINEFRNQHCLNFINNMNISLDAPFFTGGVFLFKNTKNNISILNDVFNLHNVYYAKNRPYIDGLYDETFLSAILTKNDYVKINGSANHCSANYMPLMIKNNTLYGKNPFDDEDYEPIFILHGSSNRQIYGEDFEGDIKTKIKKMWKV